MRFLLGLRTALPIATGMSALSWRMFAILNLVAAAVWALVIAIAGYAFGALLSAFIVRIERYEHLVVIVVVALALLVHLVRSHRRGSIE